MKKIIAVIAILATISVNAQSKYEAAMKKNFIQMDSAKTTADHQAVSAGFERIGDAEKTQWLPYYYAGLALTTAGWMDSKKK